MPDNKNANDRFMRFSIAMETISKNVQKYKNEQLSPFGLKSMHLMFLYCLGQSDDGLTATELSKSCGVDKAFISRMATDLRSMGYIGYADEDGPAWETSEDYATRLGIVDGVYVGGPPSDGSEDTAPSLTADRGGSIYRSRDLLRRDHDADTGELPPYDPRGY